jgi:hypothetical protein
MIDRWIKVFGTFLQKKQTLLGMLLLGSSFFVIALALLYQKWNSQEALQQELSSIERKVLSSCEDRKVKQNFLRFYQDYDPLYVKNVLEKSVFLKKDQILLKSTLDHPFCQKASLLKARKKFLQKENFLRFEEKKLFVSPSIKETEYQQQKPVELDAEDLWAFLSFIEKSPMEKENTRKKPPLFFTRFHLQKIVKNRQELFTLNTSFIQRDLFQEKP